MADGAKSMSTGFKVFLAVLFLIGTIALLWLTVWLANSNFIPKIGTDVTTHAVELPAFLGSVFGILLGVGETTTLTWEVLILHLAVFFILAFAFFEIVNLFSSFSESTSWAIAIGLAIIAGVTKIVAWIAAIFGLTAGVGAIGVALIIIAAIFSAVLLNFGVTGPLRRWRRARQRDIEEFKSERGFSKVASFVKGAKKVANEAAEGEKSK